jgi:hypothetical protein
LSKPGLCLMDFLQFFVGQCRLVEILVFV